MTNKKITILSGIIILSFAVSGCNPISVTDDQKKQIISSDSGFKNILDQKTVLDEQLAQLRINFLAEKNTYESKVNALRKEFEAKKALVFSETQEIKAKLDPYREQINTDMAVLTQELKSKNKNLKSVKAMFNQAKQALQDNDLINLPQKDQDEWQRKFNALSAELKSANEEVAIIKANLYILKLKQRSLIQ